MDRVDDRLQDKASDRVHDELRDLQPLLAKEFSRPDTARPARTVPGALRAFET
jgi:hypothetical protein